MKKIKGLLISFIGLFFLILFNSVNINASEYYIFDVKSSDVSLSINNQMYTSDENNQIKVEKNETGEYVVFSSLLKEKTYTFTDNEVIEINVPKSISINTSSSIFDADSNNEWKIMAIVSFYDDTTKNIELMIQLNDLVENQLVFKNISLDSNDYNIEEKVTLRRITLKIEEYKEKFEELKNATSDFKSKVIIVREKYAELNSIYTNENLDIDTIEYYNEYLKSNLINESVLNEWLDSIVENVRLKDNDLSVIYGDDITAVVVIESMNGLLEREIEFNYNVNDITNSIVKITSIEELKVYNGNICTYSEYVSYNINLEKRKLYSNVSNYSVIYNGAKQDISVEVINVSEKFNDIVSNGVASYFIGSQEVDPINVNTYVVNYVFDITNSNFYDLSEFIVHDFNIEKATIDNIVFEDKAFTYTGKKVDFGVNSNILRDGKAASVTYKIGNQYISSLISAGTYIVEAIIENSNYETLVLSAEIIINKATTSLGYDDKRVTKEYDGTNFDYRIKKNIYEDGSIAIVEYEIYSGDSVVDSICNIGEYRVVVTISDRNNNFEEKTDELSVVITEKPIFIDYINNSFVYNGKEHTPTIVTNIDVTVAYDSVNGLAPIDAGNYTMMVTSANPDYTIINNIYEFSILSVKVKFKDFVNIQVEYCNCNAIENVEIANIFNNDDVVANIEYRKNGEIVDNIKNVYDSYVVEVVSLSGEKALNYTLENVKTAIEVKVTPKNIMITPLNATKEYSDSDPKISYSISPSLYENDVITGDFSRDLGENVGKYKLHQGTLSAGDNYNLTIDLENSYLEIVQKPIGIVNISRRYVYDGSEQIPSISLTGSAHIEHEEMINAGIYYVNVVVDDNNYCLPKGYKDIIIIVEKRDVTSSIQLKNNYFIYTGSNPLVEIVNDYSFNVEYYNMDDELLENAIMPGNYKVKVVIDDNNEFSNSIFNITIDKKKYVLENVNIIPHYNKIAVNYSSNLEYKINNGDYFEDNQFNWLKELTEYTISVRIKEDDIGYASEPIVKVVKTTRNPSSVNQLIDILGESVNEYNMLTLKSIYNYMKDTNSSDVDSDKYAKYLLIKEKYDNILNNYSEDVEISSNLINFMNKSMYSVTISLLSLLFFVVIKKKLEL